MHGNGMKLKRQWNSLKNKKWQATIRAFGKNIYLGVFSKIEDAVATRNEAVKKYHGEYARLSVIL